MNKNTGFGKGVKGKKEITFLADAAGDGYQVTALSPSKMEDLKSLK